MADSYSTNEDVTLTISAAGVLTNDTDVDFDTLTAVLVSTTSNGSLTLNANGSFSYTPNLNFNGVDSFTYKANDGTTESSIATVTITVMAAVPTANVTLSSLVPFTNDILTATVVEDGADSLTFTWKVNGVIKRTISTSDLTDTFDLGVAGQGSRGQNVTVEVLPTNSFGNGNLTIASATVQNSAPTAANTSMSVSPTSSGINISLPATDADGDPLTYTVSSASNGTVTISGGVATYVPNPSFLGNATFTFQANDGTTLSNVGTATVNVSKLLYSLLSPTNAPQRYVEFGYSVAADADYYVVGARLASVNDVDMVGQVYVYSTATGELVRTLNNPFPNAGDQFGFSVAVSGDLIAVGTPGDDTLGSSAGTVYVFNALTGERLVTINDSVPNSGAFFGQSLALSGDILVVSAPFDDSVVSQGGKAFAFNATTGALLGAINNPNPASQDLFGDSIAISGSTVVVGSNHANGTIYVFDTSGSLLGTIGHPDKSTNGQDEFGTTVGISGNTIVVGESRDGTNDAGAVYLFDATTFGLISKISNPEPASGDWFGTAVAISGNNILVSSINHDVGGNTFSGRSYVFNSDDGSLLATLDNPDPQTSKQFGNSVAIAGDLALVGDSKDAAVSTDAGAAFAYDVTTGSLIHSFNNPLPPNKDDFFASAVAVSGSTVVVGSPGDDSGWQQGGMVAIYDGTTGSLRAILRDPSLQPNQFGSAVGISGNQIVVGVPLGDSGSPTAGEAYVFNADNGSLIRKLVNPTPASNDRFGDAVSISNNIVLVGANQDDTGFTDSGTAYLFNATTGALLWTLNNPTPAATDRFGASVAVSGNYAVVGSYQDDTNGTNAGAVYLFDVTTGALVTTLYNPSPNASDVFGTSVAISGDRIVVGASGDDNVASNVGVAYLFDTNGTLLSTLNNPFPNGGDNFGVSVAISNRFILVGANLDSTGASSAGAAYLFESSTGNFLYAYNNPTPALGDNFGQEIALSDTLAVIGALNDDTQATNQGAAYVFALDPLPTVLSIQKQTPSNSPTNVNNATFRVTFSEAVNNVDAADFAASFGSVSNVTVVSNATYDVTVTGLSAVNGNLSLSFAPGQNIRNNLNITLVNTTPTGANESYTLDHLLAFRRHRSQHPREHDDQRLERDVHGYVQRTGNGSRLKRLPVNHSRHLEWHDLAGDGKRG